MRKRVCTGLLSVLLTLSSGCGVLPVSPMDTAAPTLPTEVFPDPQQAVATPAATSVAAPTETPAIIQTAAPVQPMHTPAPSEVTEPCEGVPSPSDMPSGLFADTPEPASESTPEPVAEPTAEPVLAPTLPPIETRLGWDEGAGLSLRLGMSREDVIWQLTAQGVAYTALPDSVTVSARWNGTILPVWMTAADDAPLTEVSTVLTDLGDDPLGTLDAWIARLTGFYGAPAEDGWTVLTAGLSERTRTALSSALAAQGRCVVRWEAGGEHALLTLSDGYEERILAEIVFSVVAHTETSPKRSPFAAEMGF